jgi:transcriptional regulator with XRE-family HTH domain
MDGDGDDLVGQLREMRRRRGLSVEQAARLLGVSYTTVHHWEHGKASPSAASRDRLERLLSESRGAAEDKQLPCDPRPFIGRSQELEELARLWPGCRVLTLTGPGGIGKSRLAVELLRRPGGQVLAVADLGAVSDPALTVDSIAVALGLRPRPGVAQLEAVVGALAGRDGVVFLDTCERVAGSLRAVLQAVVASAPAVRVLATSQVPLGVPAETVWRVPGLGPAPGRRGGGRDGPRQ